MPSTPCNKLVRDRIPQIIAAGGGRPVIRTVQGEELLDALKAKLVEEAEEAARSPAREELIVELGDILEIIQALSAAAGVSGDEIERVRQERAATRGGFEEGIVLIQVDEEGQAGLDRTRDRE